MTKARDIADFKFENIVDTGTEGTKVATGTTAQRGSTAGQLRFNSDTGLAEYYTGSTFKTIDSPPTISSIDVTEVDSQAGGNQTIVITGSNFQSGATVTFIGNTGTNFNASTVTINSDTQITAVAPKSSFLNAQEPYGVKVENPSGLSVTLASQINVDTSPSWNTASGTIATINDLATGIHVTVSATDPDGDTVSYSETTSVLSGAGLTLNSSTGAISGDPTNVVSSTTNTFTLRATANSKTADRIFNIIVNPTLDGSTSALAGTPLNIYNINSSFQGSSANGLYWIQDSNINGGTPIQVYLDMNKNNVPWVLVLSNNATSQTSWTDAKVQSNNTSSAGLTAVEYSILSWADAFKPASGSWQYMIEGNTSSNATTRYYTGGVFTANVNSYSMNTTSPSQTNVTANEFFSTNISGHQTAFADNTAIGGRVPWRGGGGSDPEAVYTTYPGSSSWWGTVVTNTTGWSGYKAGAYMTGVLASPEQTRVWVRSYI